MTILQSHEKEQVGWTKESARQEIREAGIGIAPDKLQKLGLDFLVEKLNTLSLDRVTDDGLRMWIVSDPQTGQREHIYVLAQTVEGRYAIRQYANSEINYGNKRRSVGRALIRYCDRIESAYGVGAPAA